MTVEDFEGLSILETREEGHGVAAVSHGEVVRDREVEHTGECLDQGAQGLTGGANLLEGDSGSKSEEDYVMKCQTAGGR